MSEQLTFEAQNKTRAIPVWSQLRWQLTTLLALLAIAPVVIVLIVFIIQTNNQTGKQIQNQLQSVAGLKRDQIVRWLEDSQSTLDLILANQTRNNMVNALILISLSDELLSQDRPAQLIINRLLIDVVTARPIYDELFIYNVNGRVIAGSDDDQLGKVVTRQPYFKNSLIDSYVQPPYYEIGTAELALFITHPLYDSNGQVIGVLAGKLNLDILGEIMTDRASLGETGETYLVSRESNYLLTPSRFEGYPLIQAYHSEGIDRVLQAQSGIGEYDDYRDPGVPVFGAYLWVPELQAGLLAEMNKTEALAPFIPTRNFSIFMAILTAFAALVVGFYATSRVTKPVLLLTGVATRIAGGDLSQRANISQHNEIGLLASVFNQMTAQLQDLIDSLEQRVADRTQRLGIVANLSGRLVGILEFDQLLTELVDQVKEQFDYYHTHVYVVDENRQQLVMTAGAGEVGAQMKAQRHTIPITANSLVARAARTGEIVWIDNVHEAEDWLPNALLPNTAAEMAVPIILGGEVVGVLDVQEDKVFGLDESDANLLRSLANQVAVAIRNARLFAEVEKSLTEARAAQEQYIEQAWSSSKINRRSKGRVQLNLDASVPLNEDIINQARQQALTIEAPTPIRLDNQQSDAPVADESLPPQQALVAPIKLRNITIGNLQLHANDAGRGWSESDLAFVEAVVDQVAQAAESLRLLDETRERAARERLIGQISDKFRRASDIEMLMKMGVEALSQVLTPSRTFVYFGSEAELGSADEELSADGTPIESGQASLANIETAPTNNGRPDHGQPGSGHGE